MINQESVEISSGQEKYIVFAWTPYEVGSIELSAEIEDNDDSDGSYADPMKDNNSLYSRIYSFLAVASLGTSATGLVLYFIDGGTFSDLIKPPSINSS